VCKKSVTSDNVFKNIATSKQAITTMTHRAINNSANSWPYKSDTLSTNTYNKRRVFKKFYTVYPRLNQACT